jgi:hypothetical protein
VPVDEVVAGQQNVGDVVRLDDPQAHRVQRLVIVEGRVVVELRGLEVRDAIRVTLSADAVVGRLGTARDLIRRG